MRIGVEWPIHKAQTFDSDALIILQLTTRATDPYHPFEGGRRPGARKN